MKTLSKLGIRTNRTTSERCIWMRNQFCAPETSTNLKNERESTDSRKNGNTTASLMESDECIHMANVYKIRKLKGAANSNHSKIIQRNRTVQPPRKNEFNIQMLSEELHRKVFGEVPKVKKDIQVISEALSELNSHGLLTDDVPLFEDVNLDIPPLRGRNIEEHFLAIGKEQSEAYKNLTLKFINKEIPKRPDIWLMQKGWTKYVPGQEPMLVSHPDEDILVFDVEVCVRFGDLPTLATAVSENAWYGWVSSVLCDKIDDPPTQFCTTNSLIPFYDDVRTKKNTPRLIISHNVSYDRARIKEEYNFESTGLRFLDTMSLHVCIGGLTRNQKETLKKPSPDDICETEQVEAWKIHSCLSSLKDVYNLYCKKELLKDQRKPFLEGTLSDIRKDFNSLMEYCSNDVVATQEVLKVIFPIFLERFPHPVTLAGMLEMSTAYMTVSDNWKKFLTEADQTYDDLKNELSLILSKKSDYACRLFHNDSYKQDLWMWNEDWSTQTFKLTKKKLPVNAQKAYIEASTWINNTETCEDNKSKKEAMLRTVSEEDLDEKYQYLFHLGLVLPKNKPFLPGYPFWYRKLCEKTDFIVQPTTGMLVTPKLLHLTWEKYPVHYTREFGWGILVADIYATQVNTALPFQKLRSLTLKNLDLTPDSELPPGKSIAQLKAKQKRIQCPSYYNGAGIWCNHTIDDCCYFFKLPHKDGPNKNVGNPLSKDFTQGFANNFLAGMDYSARKVIDLGSKLTYWRNNRDRVYDQMVVWLNKKESPGRVDNGTSTGVILPKVVVSGTLTRRALEATWLTASRVVENRIGSELRSLIQAPPGYHIVGADVDSQELWIASLIGDSNAGKIHGITPLGWMTLSGNKASGTDMHSMTAKAVGISRDHAKVINYSRIYGAGVNFAEKLLQQFHPGMGHEEARQKAHKMYSLTKGNRVYAVRDEMKAVFAAKFNILKTTNSYMAHKYSGVLGKKIFEVFKKCHWVGGTESAMFNRLEEIALSAAPTTPFLSCRLSRALESQFEGDDHYMTTRINWVVQSGAVDFLHLMLVCMRWLTKGQIRYCFSFHDEIRYLVPSEKRYGAALAVHITNLLVRAFCSHRLGMYDLPRSVAFFSSVEVDKILRKEADDDCITPSNPHGMERGYGIPPGESLDIYQTIEKAGGTLSMFNDAAMSKATKRKHVHREALEEDLTLPDENQLIVRILSSRGNNLHEVLSPDQSTFLVSMPTKFRKNIWIKKGDYILVEPIEEGGKVKAEMVKVLRENHIKYLKNENAWPLEFSSDNLSKATEEEEDEDIFVNKNQSVESDRSNSSSDESN